MATVITHAAGTITPAALEEWEASAETRSIVHTILGRPDPDITSRPTGLRRGKLTLTFASGADAYAARKVLAVPQVLTLANPAVAQISMTFIVAGGDLGDVLKRAGHWTLTVPFQEISQ